MTITIQESKCNSYTYDFTVTKDENNEVKGYYVESGKKHYVTGVRRTRCNYLGEKYEAVEIKGKLSDIANIEL